MEKDLFSEKITMYQESMYRIAYSILRNNEDVKDALQETVLKAWSNCHHLRNQDCFRPWLLHITVNECRNLLRKKKNTVSLEVYQDAGKDVPDVSLNLLLLNLPEKDRLILTLRYAENMEEKEMAQVLHLPVTTVRGRLFRARQMLRKEYEYEEK